MHVFLHRQVVTDLAHILSRVDGRDCSKLLKIDLEFVGNYSSICRIHHKGPNLCLPDGILVEAAALSPKGDQMQQGFEKHRRWLCCSQR